MGLEEKEGVRDEIYASATDNVKALSYFKKEEDAAGKLVDDEDGRRV